MWAFLSPECAYHFVSHIWVWIGLRYVQSYLSITHKARGSCRHAPKHHLTLDKQQCSTRGVKEPWARAAVSKANYYWKLGWKILLLEFQFSATSTAKISWYMHTLLTSTWHMTLSMHAWLLQSLCWGLCLFLHWALLALVLQHGLMHFWLPRIYVLPGSSWFAWQHSA